MESGDKSKDRGVETDAFRTRLSMNTSLRNANIFDDETWMEVDGVEIKKEKRDVTLKQEKIIKMDDKNNIKQIETEILRKIETEASSSEEEVNIIIKQGIANVNQYSISTKIEKGKIKQEKGDDEVTEESFIGETTIIKEKMQITQGTSTKIKLEPKEVNQENPTDDRILNSLNGFAIVTPIKSEIDETQPNNEHIKSIKRTIFTRNSPYKNTDTEMAGNIKHTILTRNSPYKKEVNEIKSLNKTAEKSSIFNRLGPKAPKKRVNSGSEESTSRNSSESDKGPLRSRLGPGPAKKKRTKEIESNIEVLARRQKQIDYGKNTAGYDNYIKTVPRKERSLECPKTPDKFQKYSRRAWDGLIRQWRLKLHKYDPEESQNNLEQIKDK